MGAVTPATFFGGAKYIATSVNQVTHLGHRLWVFDITGGGHTVTLPPLIYTPLGYRLLIIANNGGGSNFSVIAGAGGGFSSTLLISNRAFIMSTVILNGSKVWINELFTWS